MSNDRYERIRSALAMRPTPGPWEVTNGTDVFTQLGARNAAGVGAAANDGWHIADCDMGPSSTEEGKADIPSVEKRANAALIAACDPDTIRDLLAKHDALEAENERLREALVRILENEAPDWKFAEEFGGYVLDDELREEARAALAKAETQKCPSDVNDTTRGS